MTDTSGRKRRSDPTYQVSRALESDLQHSLDAHSETLAREASANARYARLWRSVDELTKVHMGTSQPTQWANGYNCAIEDVLRLMDRGDGQ